LKDDPTIPTSAAGVNLIQGSVADVLAFLEALSDRRKDTTSVIFRQNMTRNKVWLDSHRSKD
jgi:hypothetical protein